MVAYSLIAIIAIIVGIVIGWALGDIQHRYQGMQQNWQELQKRIDQLEQAQAKHLPHNTADEIENATAALLYVKQANDLRADMLDNCLAHLQKARNGNKK